MIVPQHLVAQLDRCTVQVHGEDGFVGSGVLVAPGVVLTCAHVVKDAQSACTVMWQRRSFALVSEPELFPPLVDHSSDSYPFPDLAVLRLAKPPSHPCVRLSMEDPLIGSQVYASGFSTRTLTHGTATDGLLVQVAAQSGNFLRVKHDQIYGGLSGSPVLDVTSDRVCGLVKATRAENDQLGGWIIPATAFGRYLQPVVEANRAYHSEGPGWDQLLQPEVLPAALRDLLEAERKASRETPYQLTGAPRLNLADIYVRQQLDQRLKESNVADGVREEDDSKKDYSRKKNGVGKNLGAEPAARSEDMSGSGTTRDLGTVLALHHDLLVTGGPGAGKSTLTLQLAGELAGAWLDRDAPARFGHSHSGFQISRPLVPLRVSARSLVANRELGWLGALAKAATKELHLRSEISAELISTPIAGAPWLILIDALDEIADRSAYLDLLSLLADCMAGQGGYFPHKLLITSRVAEEGDSDRFTSAGGCGTYALVPFDEPALRLFARRWFSRKDGAREDLAERFLAQVGNARLAEVVAIPLMATVAAIVFEQDPDKRLPNHAYQLYQRYLEYLLSGRDRAFMEQWPQVERKLSARRRGKLLADKLHEERIGLVEHLAVKWIESSPDLANEAAEWVRQIALEVDALSDLEPLNLRETAFTIVMTTGLFVHEGENFFFLHQSLAEHLAARVYAERLPDRFVPSEANLRSWIDRAAIEGMPGLAHTVLTHYTYLRSSEEMIAWLQRQTVPFYQLLAGELISFGAASRPDEVRIFCAAFRDWAHWPVSGFSWVPARVFSRSLAALGELLEHSCVESVLNQIAVDQLVALSRRVWTAEVLANAGHPHTGGGIAVLHQVLADPQAEAGVQLRAARAIAGLGPEYREDAVAGLRRLVANRHTTALVRCWTAESLAGLDQRYREEAATTLREIIADPATNASGRDQAAWSLAGLGPEYREEAATTLRKILADPATNASDRDQAARSLAGLDPKYREEAATTLRKILADPATNASDRQQATRSLAGLDPKYREETVGALRQVIADSATDASDRQQAARSLAGLDPKYREETLTTLREIITDPATSASDRQHAAQTMARLDPDDCEEAVTALRGTMTDRRTGLLDRTRAAFSLVELGPQYYVEATTAVRRALAERPSDALDLRRVAESLVGLDPKYREEAATALRRALAKRRFGALDLRWITESLVRLDPKSQEEAATALRRALAKRPRGLDLRWIAESLAGLGPEYREDAAITLREIIADPATSASDRQQTAQLFAGLNPKYREEAATTLREIIADPATGASDRQQTARSLAELNPKYREEAATTLRKIIADPGTGGLERQQVARSLAGLDPAYREEAATTLRKIIADPGTGGLERQQVARSLAGLDPAYREEAATTLRKIMAEPAAGGLERSWAAKSLAGLDPAYRDEAATTLREIIADPATNSYDRQQAARSLAELDPAYREEAATTLRRIMADPATNSYDRQQAARSLAQLDPAYRDEAATTLRKIIADPATNSYDRQQAARSLAELDPKYLEETAAENRITGSHNRRSTMRLILYIYVFIYVLLGIVYLVTGKGVMGIGAVVAGIITVAVIGIISRFRW